MKEIKIYTFIKKFFLSSLLFFLPDCTYANFFDEPGLIANQQHFLILKAFLIMLIIVIPTLFMTVFFVYKYRSSKKNMEYDPTWKDSKTLEIIIWTVPIIIIFFLAKMSWISTHNLDPKKNIATTFLTKSIDIEVVSLDWKWLFIYPKYHIATINEICIPANTPINFKITSNSNMNSFFIPNLGSQIYAMAGMKTTLHLISNKTGVCKGISANYSGYGFSGMKFTVTTIKDRVSFLKWVKKVNSSQKVIDNMSDFKKIAIPDQNHPVEHFSHVYSKLFIDIIRQFIPQAK